MSRWLTLVLALAVAAGLLAGSEPATAGEVNYYLETVGCVGGALINCNGVSVQKNGGPPIFPTTSSLGRWTFVIGDPNDYDLLTFTMQSPYQQPPVVVSCSIKRTTRDDYVLLYPPAGVNPPLPAGACDVKAAAATLTVKLQNVQGGE